MNRIERSNTVFYQFESLMDVTHGVFTRLGGASASPYDSLNVGSTVGDDPLAVMDNRHRLAETLDVREADTRTTWQVHGKDVVVVDSSTPRPYPPPKGDAIITCDPGVPLVMRFADCVPLLIYDPEHRALALAHAGWRGTVAHIGPAVVSALVEAFDSRPENLIVGVGPSIGPCCYEVGAEVVEQVAHAFDGSDGLIRVRNGGSSRRFDLWAANRRALHDAGVRNIDVAEMCTSCNRREFFSHRAEKGRTGRFGVLAYMPASGSTWARL